jgi:Zn-finger nucleic acid-binding protein
MRPTNYNYSSGIIIDSCPNGHGVWLDNLELEKVQANGEHWTKQAVKHSAEWSSLAKKAYDKESGRWKNSHKDDIGKSIISRLIRKLI